eukprot:gene7064-5710_t
MPPTVQPTSPPSKAPHRMECSGGPIGDWELGIYIKESDVLQTLFKDGSRNARDESLWRQWKWKWNDWRNFGNCSLSANGTECEPDYDAWKCKDGYHRNEGYPFVLNCNDSLS